MRRIPISALASLGYCERYFYLRYVLGLRLRATRALIKGANQHRLSMRLDTAKRYGRENIQELVARLRDANGVVVLPRETLRLSFVHDGCTFVGRADRVLKLKNIALVVEEKFVSRSSGRVRRSYEYQLAGYCHALKFGRTGYSAGSWVSWLPRELFRRLEVRYMVVERCASTRRVLFASRPRNYRREDFLRVLDRALGILRGEVRPSPRDSCRGCSLAGVCA
ncbi:CRISPR-associated protein Cas4 [Candidatus Pyrohabitans sp.]